MGSQQAVAAVVYEDAVTADQGSFPKDPDNLTERNKRGIIRFENILSGGSQVSRKEAEFFHRALAWSFGDAWANKISAKELIQFSPRELIARGTILDLPWPSLLNPAITIETMLTGFTDDGLRLSVLQSGQKRVGLDPQSPLWSSLEQPTLKVLHPADTFELKVTGLRPGVEQLVVFSLCHKPIKDAAASVSYPVFVTAWIREPSSDQIVTTGENGFCVVPNLGQYAWAAIAVPKSWELQERLELRRRRDALTIEEAGALVARLNKMCVQAPKAIRTVVVPYFIAPKDQNG